MHNNSSTLFTVAVSTQHNLTWKINVRVLASRSTMLTVSNWCFMLCSHCSLQTLHADIVRCWQTFSHVSPCKPDSFGQTSQTDGWSVQWVWPGEFSVESILGSDRVLEGSEKHSFCQVYDALFWSLTLHRFPPNLTRTHKFRSSRITSKLSCEIFPLSGSFPPPKKTAKNGAVMGTLLVQS